MRLVVALFAFGFVLFSQGTGNPLSTMQASAQGKSYGCYKVINASSVRIRKRPYLWSKTLGYAQRGETVVKNRRFCSIRGTWCRIRKGTLSGWMGKKFLQKTSC